MHTHWMNPDANPCIWSDSVHACIHTQTYKRRFRFIHTCILTEWTLTPIPASELTLTSSNLHVWWYVCVYASTYVNMYFSWHWLLRICMCVDIFIYIYIYTHTYISQKDSHTHTHTHTHTYAHTHTHKEREKNLLYIPPRYVYSTKGRKHTHTKRKREKLT